VAVIADVVPGPADDVRRFLPSAIVADGKPTLNQILQRFTADPAVLPTIFLTPTGVSYLCSAAALRPMN